jgi:hypothetical protein
MPEENGKTKRKFYFKNPTNDLRREWDVVSEGKSKEEMIRIAYAALELCLARETWRQPGNRAPKRKNKMELL